MTLHIAIVGSGPSGMTAAMLLARQGHRITLVDRDPGPEADRPWERVGVMQFHHPHSLRAPGRMLLAERLPDVHDALVAAGAEVRIAPGMPEAMAGMHVRRSVLEQAIWECTSREPGVHRLTGHVDEIVVVGDRARGVVVDGTFVPADLVVDASGRAGRLGAEHRPRSEGAPAGVAYATRQYQLLPGATPGPTNGGPGLIKEHDGFMQLVFTHDRGTFSLLLVRADDDTELAELRHEHVFEAAVAALPESSAWTDPARARPIDQVRAGSGLVNSYQGQPTALGFLAIGDAFCTTNPAGSRGLSLGMMAAAALADIVATQARRAVGDRARRLGHRPHPSVVRGAHRRRRLAARDLAPVGGRTPSRPIPWNVVAPRPRRTHPEWMRFLGPFLGMAAGPESIDPLREQVRAMLRAGWRPGRPDGITRDELVAVLEGACVAGLGAVGAEELVEEGGALLGEHSADHLGAMVEPAVADHVPQRPDRTGLVVVRTEHDPVDAREHQRPGAHRAGLEGHHEGAAGQPPLADGAGRLAHGHDLGVAGRVAVALADVAARADDLAGGGEHDGADRYVAPAGRRRREVEGRPHGCVPAGHPERPTSSSNLPPKPTLSATSLRISSG